MNKQSFGLVILFAVPFFVKAGELFDRSRCDAKAELAIYKLLDADIEFIVKTAVERVSRVVRLTSCGGIVKDEVETLRYEISCEKPVDGKYYIDLSTKYSDDIRPEDRVVLGIRIVFMSRGGVMYYSSIKPDAWPSTASALPAGSSKR